jgi:hypothetical protein
MVRGDHVWGSGRKLTLASLYPKPLIMVGKNPETEPRVRFIPTYQYLETFPVKAI